MDQLKKPPGMRTAKSKQPFKVVVDGSTSTTALNTTPAAAGEPTTQVVKCEDFAKARLIFGGGAAADKTVNYQVILWYRVFKTKTQFIPVVVAHGTYTLGAMVMPAQIIAANGKIADTVSDDTGWDGLVIESPQDDNVAMIEIDLRGAEFLTIETDLGTAASATVLVQLGD